MLIAAMCSAIWLGCSNVLPLRGEQQATECAHTLRLKHDYNFEMERVCLAINY